MQLKKIKYLIEKNKYNKQLLLSYFCLPNLVTLQQSIQNYCELCHIYFKEMTGKKLGSLLLIHKRI